MIFLVPFEFHVATPTKPTSMFASFVAVVILKTGEEPITDFTEP
jgi:hypothetical protein